jgi:ribA/ribD-fused uncharacterized protein
MDTQREKLIAGLEAGQAVEGYELFYGGWCSQWAPTPFVLEGARFATAEHYMMASKARLFGDDVALGAIMTLRDPALVKSIGRTVRGFETRRWAAVRYDVVLEGNRAKFAQHRKAREYLLSTGNKVIVEASPTDRIWGVGLDEEDPRCHDPRQWKGENLLGFAIMQVRHELRSGGVR